MSKLNNALKRIVNDHHVVLFTGVMFLISGLLQFVNVFIGEWLGVEIEIEFEFILLGVFNILMSVVFVVMGTRTIETVEDQLHEKKHPNPLPAKSPEELQKIIDSLEKRIIELEKNSKN